VCTRGTIEAGGSRPLVPCVVKAMNTMQCAWRTSQFPGRCPSVRPSSHSTVSDDDECNNRAHRTMWRMGDAVTQRWRDSSVPPPECDELGRKKAVLSGRMLVQLTVVKTIIGARSQLARIIKWGSSVLLYLAVPLHFSLNF